MVLGRRVASVLLIRAGRGGFGLGFGSGLGPGPGFRDGETLGPDRTQRLIVLLDLETGTR